MVLPLNERLYALTESATIALADRVRQLQAAGKTIIALQTGDPDFHTPAAICDAATLAMRAGHTHYSNSRGLPALREAIAGWLRQSHGAIYDPQTEILATHGAIHAYYCGLQAILNPGDEVLVPDPTWQTHANMVRALRGEAVRVPSEPENGFWPTLEALERALSPRTVALVINSPNNPTGMVADRDYLLKLNTFAAAHHLYVIADEVYDRILYDGREHVCFGALPDAKGRTLLVNSLSKTYAMTGWRVGYLAASEAVINQALKASQHSITNLAPFIQHAATFALTDPAMAEASAQMARSYAHRRERVMQLWQDFGPAPIRLQPPQGAFYFFMDIRALNTPSVEVAERLLDEAGVSVVPGAAYGSCGEGFLRMTIAASDADIEAGLGAILEWAARL
jgi:aspartate/methionine/tyrosine aminotransferase